MGGKPNKICFEPNGPKATNPAPSPMGFFPQTNQTRTRALMNEKHTLLEWLILFRKYPELREEFDKITIPQPIK